MCWCAVRLRWDESWVGCVGIGLVWNGVMLRWVWLRLGWNKIGFEELGWEWVGSVLACCVCHSSLCVAHPPLRSLYSVIFACRGAVALAVLVPPPPVFAQLLPVIVLCFRCASFHVFCVVSVYVSVRPFI